MGVEINKKSQYSLKRTLWDVGIFSFGVNVLMLVIPLYMLQVYERVLSSFSIDTLIFISIIAVFALIVLGSLEAVRSMYAARLANRFEITYAQPAMRHAMSGRDMNKSGQTVIQSLIHVRGFLNSRLAFIFFDIPFAPLFIGVLYFIHPTLFWMTIGGIIALLIVALVNQWATNKAGRKARNAEIGNSVNGQTLLESAETLRALGMTDNALRQWEDGQLNLMDSNDSRASVTSFMTGLSKTIRLTLQIAILGVGAYLVLQKEMVPGMIFAASIVASKALQPVDQLIGSWRQITDGIIAWRKIIKAAHNFEKNAHFTDLPEPKGEIVVQNLMYYPTRQQGQPATVKGVSFAIKPGQTLAIIGESGAGKSTLLRLLSGAIVPSSGDIRIDNNEISNWNPEKLGRHIGYVEQRIMLLLGTIAQNIARFDEDVDDQLILEAANDACVSTTIERMGEGYQTFIQPGTQRLSGGEMQQIGLARAFYGDPQILLMDEPNSALDPGARRRFDEAIIAAKSKGKTIIIITQRDEVLAHADMVLAMRQGQRVDFGPRDAVLKRLFDVNPKAANQAAPTKPVPQNQSPFANFGAGMKPITSSSSKG